MHTIELTHEQMTVIGAALAELPYKIAAPVISAIQKQITAKGEQDPAKEQNEAPAT